jgi:hypothetical protein
LRRPLVELLYFEGCPNHEATRVVVEQVAAELQVEPELTIVRVSDPEAAAEHRFLGSPTVRVDGRDVEPGAEERGEFVLSCRVYRTAQGLSAQPDADWIRDALRRAAA